MLATMSEAHEAFVGKGSGSVTTFEDAVVRHLIEAVYKSGGDGARGILLELLPAINEKHAQ
jgi:hypothetical protein